MAGDDTQHDVEAHGRARLAPALQIPKNRSTGNLGVMGDNSEKARLRFSFDAGAAPTEYDTLSRSAWVVVRGKTVIVWCAVAEAAVAVRPAHE